ncbi:MAG: hypothetical protein ACK4NY_24225 [Spirosomataceae bacterium]
MKKSIIIMVAMIAIAVSTQAQRVYDDYRAGTDYYYYDEQFDWHWDVRVRISDGIRNGLITNREANRLYNELERIERKEYAYASDGFFDGWEQDEIWDDIRYLNRQIGFELYDYDRSFYGFSPRGVAYRGYYFWYDRRGYDFYRFDKRGYGNQRSGYYPRKEWSHLSRSRSYDHRRDDYSRNRDNRTNNPRGYDNERYSRNERYGDRGTDYRNGNNNDRESRNRVEERRNDGDRGTDYRNNNDRESRNRVEERRNDGDRNSDYRNNNDRESRNRVEERRTEGRNNGPEERQSRDNRYENRSNENRNGQINERNSRGSSQSTERNNNDSGKSRYEERYGNGRGNDAPKEREHRRQ